MNALRGGLAHLVHGLGHPGGWALWTLPRRALGYVVAVQAVALTLTGLLMATHPPVAGDLAVAGWLLAAGIGQGELGRHIERSRRRYTLHGNVTSAWAFPAAMLLPAGWVAVVVAGLHLHLGWRCWGRLEHRLVFNASVVVLAAQAAHALPIAGYAGLAAGIGVYAATNALLIAGATALTSDRGTLTVRRLFGGRDENVLEIATICLGATVAILLPLGPPLVLLLVLPLFVLHRSVLIRQLEEAASTDEKTGLLNATAWHDQARRMLCASPTVGVLMIDLDHFKLVNDRHGHLTGDLVLRRVAQALADEVRRGDLVGRFGGEEFVVAVPNVTLEQLGRIAERICLRIRRVGITASVGGALYPAMAEQLDELLMIADRALFLAKNAGRDRACVPVGPRSG